MRAKMSNRSGRRPSVRAFLPGGRGFGLALGAEQEARAILAETEPRYDPRQPWDAGWSMTGNETPEACAGRALAESLASFVAA